MSTLTGKILGMSPRFGSSFGFIEASLAEVANELFAWHQELGFEPVRTEFDGGLVQNAQKLLPLTAAPTFRDLIIKTASGNWTACFSANPFGGDPSGATQVLGRRLGAPVLTVTSIPFSGEPGSIEDVLGGVLLTYSPNPTILDGGRSIAVVEGESSSSRYHFETWGELQPWEHPERYNARLKRDRFNPELLEEYCQALGIDVFNLDFYSGPSVFMERTKCDG